MDLVDGIVKEFHLDQENTFDKTTTKHLLSQIQEQLISAQAQLVEKNKTNLPKLTELKRRKEALLREYEGLREESTKISLIDPIHMLERRKNDAKTEGEYIDKILNRNIHEEFVNLMLNEIKSVVYKSTTIESILSDGLEQISVNTIPGCTTESELQLFNCSDSDDSNVNREQRQSNNEQIQISSRTEKICKIIDKCVSEVCTKVYPEGLAEQEQFYKSCVNILMEYFDRINRLRRGKGSNEQQQQNHEKLMNLPQFTALLLNDLSFVIAFIKLRFKSSSQSSSNNTMIIDLNNRIVKLKLNALNSFINEIKITELNPILSLSKSQKNISNNNNNNNLLKDHLERVIKRLNIFLSRLFGVLSAILVKIDMKIIKFNLINYVETFCWNEIVLNLRDIDTDELDHLITFSTNINEMIKKFTQKESTEEESKFECLRVNVLSASLVEIINFYHQHGFEGKIAERELFILIDAIFAYSPLKSEFLREIELDLHDKTKVTSSARQRRSREDNEDYF